MSEISMERKRDLLRICNHRLRDGVDAVCLKASELQIFLNYADRLAAIERDLRELADAIEIEADERKIVSGVSVAVVYEKRHTVERLRAILDPPEGS